MSAGVRVAMVVLVTTSSLYGDAVTHFFLSMTRWARVFCGSSGRVTNSGVADVCLERSTALGCRAAAWG